MPFCLWDFKHEINKGDLIVLAVFGGGFTRGATLVKWEY
ncbi:MAG TPA: 3-oxoacyl-[acyl-carrier-protein] synthase III C-terminal domain-containing protein [Chitinophagaceae bacterium]|nr:3-oxoacyl-[acyl-carrier-protein] synthase III C-terminal domain-containing protein [Chitinophagaceae bacterium]